MKPEIITLCGSTKFQEEFIAKNAELTGDGKIVLSVGFFGHKQAEPMPREVKAPGCFCICERSTSLTPSMCSTKVVISVSPQSVIVYARSTGKRVYYMEALAYPYDGGVFGK